MNPETKDSFPEDATQTKEVWFIGDRGVALAELKIRFQVQIEQASWHELLAKLNIEIARVGRVSRAGFFSLPESVSQFRPFLSATTSLNEERPGWATWDFHWSRAENDSPPESIVRSTRAVGRFPDVLERLGAVWPVASRTQAQVSGRYIVFGDLWRFTLAPPKAKTVVAGERALKVRPTQWAIDPPSGCVSEVTETFVPGPEKNFILIGGGTYTLQWTPRFLNEVDGAIWDGLKIFLELRRSKSKR